MEKQKKIKWARWLLLGLITTAMLGLITWFGVHFWPLLKDAFQEGGQERLREYLRASGVKGILILYLLQTMQIFLAFFPSMTIQIAGGITYGIFYGMVICLAGIVTGNAIIFSSMRLFGPKVAELFRGEKREKEDEGKYAFLKTSKNVGLILFIIFLTPGIPNGILPYIAAGTKITFRRYMLVVTVASIPNILYCTYLGDRIIRGQFVEAVIILAVVLVAALLVYLFRGKIMDRLKKQ
ncbi:MAG: VTT domain-containing protein [Eubacteriales bacterium]|nr:VTT domain-containing protein [Eubacteriales bacterium]